MDSFKVGETCGNTSLEYSSLPQRDLSFLTSTEQVIDCGLNLPQPVDNLTLKFPLSETRQCLDGLQVRFRAIFQIRNSDGTKLTTDLLMAPVCGIAGAVINKMELWSSGRPIRTWNLFCYMYHVLNLLHRGKQWFSSTGTCNGFIPDDTTADPDAVWVTNDGLAARREWAQRSKEFEVVDTLFCPPFLQERLIPSNNHQWSIHLHLNNSDFVLFKQEQVKKDYKLYLIKAELLITKVDLSERAVQNVSRHQNLLIPFVDYDIQSFSLYEGLLQRTLPATSLDIHPKRFYIMIVSQKQVAGDPLINPFIYRNHDLEAIQLDVGGRIFESSELDFVNMKVSPPYWNLVYRALGKTDGDFLLSINSWARMYTIFCFDVTPTRFGAECPMLTAPAGPAMYTVSVKFKKALGEPCQLLVITETERVMNCAQSGLVTIS